MLVCLANLEAQEVDTIWVDRFESAELIEWTGRRDNYADVYTLENTDKGRVLSASSLHEDNFLIKKFEVDIVKYPYLNWSWKVESLPVEGDESVKETCDVAACINVVLKASKWRPRSIKYSWSTTLPIGTRTKSPFAIWPSRCDIVVMQSGDDNIEKWQTEKVNVLEHYCQLYQKKKPKSLVIQAMVIMTDSDNTGTISQAKYDDIFFTGK